MGPELGDVGAYEVFDPNSSEPDFNDSESPGNAAPTPDETIVFAAPAVVAGAIRVTPQPAKKPTGPATRFEWRTPPLWGVRDSGPYLHDGRAATLDQAIAFHNGEAAATARRYFALKPVEHAAGSGVPEVARRPDRGRGAGPGRELSAGLLGGFWWWDRFGRPGRADFSRPRPNRN